MGAWTSLRIKDTIRYNLNAVGTHVTIESLYGSWTQSIEELKRKVNDHDILPDVRKMCKAMLDFAEKETHGTQVAH